MDLKYRASMGASLEDATGKKRRDYMRKLLSVMMVVLLMIGVLPMNVEADDTAFEVDSWERLYEAFMTENKAILTADIIGDANSVTLFIPAGKTMTLDLNGHIIDRGLTEAKDDGYFVKVLGELVINDSKPNATHNPAITYTDAIENKTVTVNGGIITGGYNNKDGGAIINDGTLTINGGTLCGNRGIAGGAILNGTADTKETAKLIINGGSISGNTSTNASGGAIKNDATMEMKGGLISANSVIRETDNGAAIWNTNVLVISGGTISSHKASFGGAIYNSNGKCTFSGGTISGNRAKNGGAICSLASLTISGGTIKDNEAREKGGAVYAYKAGKNVTVKGGLIENNRAQIGGAFYTDNNYLYISGGTISKNIAYSTQQYRGGGGAYVGEEGICEISGGIITENEAYHDGGGVCASGKVKILENALIEGNKAEYGGGVYVAPYEVRMGGSTMTMLAGKISQNTASYLGGGVYVQLNVGLELLGGMIVDNVVLQREEKRSEDANHNVTISYIDGNGGGIYSAGNLSLAGGQISGNKAPFQGGGSVCQRYARTQRYTSRGCCGKLCEKHSNGTRKQDYGQHFNHRFRG